MSANETLTSKRNSSIELLRIVAMIGVILLHYNNKTVGGGMAYVEKDSLNYTILCVIEALTITAVDVYILITGYYLSKKETRNLFRVFELIFQVCFFKEVIYFLEIYSGQAVSLRRLFGNLIPNNYFVVLYCLMWFMKYIRDQLVVL